MRLQSIQARGQKGNAPSLWCWKLRRREIVNNGGDFHKKSFYPLMLSRKGHFFQCPGSFQVRFLLIFRKAK
jgi:hypothetical protein